MPELMSLLGSERAEQVAEKLRQCEPDASPTEELLDAIRAAGTMASLTLYAWDAVQQFVGKGAEGGRAREFVGKAFLALATWLMNIRVAIHIAERWHERVTSPLFLDELRHLENRLQQAHSSAEQLLTLVNGPPPALPQEVLERIEAAGQADDKTEYLDAETFLARARALKGS
jgi:hypothetical protein